MIGMGTENIGGVRSMSNKNVKPLRQRPSSAARRALAAHVRALQQRHLRELFAEDPARGERLTAEGAGLFLDY